MSGNKPKEPIVNRPRGKVIPRELETINMIEFRLKRTNLNGLPIFHHKLNLILLYEVRDALK